MALASTGQVLRSTRQWLKPLVHILLSCGVTWREFAELAKSIYVEVAMEKFGKRGRPTNISRMAILTGLARRDVRKQKELLSQAPSALPGYVTKASLVLSAWHLNPDFRDKQGRPAILRPTGKGKTFEGLIEQAGGADVRASTLLKELVSAGTVRIRSDGRLQAMQRDYIPHKMDEELIRLWGTVVADVATTYVHNLTRTATGDKRLERSAVNDQMPKDAVPAFAEMLEKEAQAFLERVDEWLTAHQIRPSGKRPPPEAVRLGIGLYQIQDSQSNARA